MQDLEEAVDCNRQALQLLPFGNPGRSLFLSNLSHSFTIRFEQTGMMKDLDEAINCNREARL